MWGEEEESLCKRIIENYWEWESEVEGEYVRGNRVSHREREWESIKDGVWEWQKEEESKAASLRLRGLT